MKRYAVCGVSHRAINMFIRAMCGRYKKFCKLVALLDIDYKRFEECKAIVPETESISTYNENQFDQMVEETKPDVVIVASKDCTHAYYIIKALEHNLDVISEKPMVTTSDGFKKVLKAQAKSKGRVVVSFNFRYSPLHCRIKEIIASGRYLGRITHIEFNDFHDTRHGASYFQRWNRLRQNSGGLSIHKCCHHFDLVNWWIQQTPINVCSYGALNFYGDKSELNPAKSKKGKYCSSCTDKLNCAYICRWNDVNADDDHINNIRLEWYSGYKPDACIFDREIDIEDTYVSIVKYDRGALMSYSVSFSNPYEGYSLAVNGTRGRLEVRHFSARNRIPFKTPGDCIYYYPLFNGARETIEVLEKEGAHGGGDPLILRDLFVEREKGACLQMLGNIKDAQNALFIGEALYKSSSENRAIKFSEMFN